MLDSGPARWDGSRPLTPSPTITCKGHSWIYSDNGLLEAAIADVLGVTVRNLGIGGQTSTEVAIRTGGIIPLLTLAGNQIPADTTAVSVTAIQPSGDYRTNGSSSYTYPGTLAGVAGTLTETLQAQGSNPVWTFTRTSAGDAVTVLPNTPFLVTGDAHEDKTTVIMCAQNNLYTVDATMRSVMRDIEAMIGTLTPVVKRYLIVGEFTFPTDGDNATGGPLARRNKILAINSERAAKWPNNFYDLRRDFIDIGMQVGGLVPNADDISKINHDTTPLGILKSEADTHPNATGYAVVGKLIAKQLVARGWATYAGSTPPAAPAITATGSAGSATINVTVPNNGGSAITDYVVQFRQAGTTRWFTHFDGISTATSIPVSGLTAGSWEFRVTAINAIGPSDPSAVVSATVTGSADTTPPTAPTSVTATAGDGQATITFSGATDNVAVTQYRVYSNADAYTTPIATGAGSPITVTVPNGVPVRFQVSAGDAGNNWSPPVGVVERGHPDRGGAGDGHRVGLVQPRRRRSGIPRLRVRRQRKIVESAGFDQHHRQPARHYRSRHGVLPDAAHRRGPGGRGEDRCARYIEPADPSAAGGLQQLLPSPDFSAGRWIDQQDRRGNKHVAEFELPDGDVRGRRCGEVQGVGFDAVPVQERAAGGVRDGRQHHHVGAYRARCRGYHGPVGRLQTDHRVVVARKICTLSA
ncbi:hypothetical protein NJ76_19575 [Rhodococcus sp. IITR03]|nr:hypothetical protein NJ76_19575 [Rhodococcus sp. IITR03]